MPGSTPATSQLDWLISTTAMIVLSWSKATRDLLKSFGWGIRALHQLVAATNGAISSPPAPYHLSAGPRSLISLPPPASHAATAPDADRRRRVTRDGVALPRPRPMRTPQPASSIRPPSALKPAARCAPDKRRAAFSQPSHGAFATLSRRWYRSHQRTEKEQQAATDRRPSASARPQPGTAQGRRIRHRRRCCIVAGIAGRCRRRYRQDQGARPPSGSFDPERPRSTASTAAYLHPACCALQRRLRIVAAEFEKGARSFDPGGMLKTGATLVRQWRGQTHTVLVREDGFEYEGHRYRSLSVIAERITGAHWSGPRFFGLIKRARAF